MPEILAILFVDEPYPPRTFYLPQSLSFSPSPDGSDPAPISLPTTSLLKLWSPYSFWHPLLASHVFSVTSSFSCTSPWASTPALHLSPAIIFSPNATVEPPPDIHMKALNSLNHHGSQDLGIPTSMVREAEFEEIIKWNNNFQQCYFQSDIWSQCRGL